jgi:hypothetical protein
VSGVWTAWLRRTGKTKAICVLRALCTQIKQVEEVRTTTHKQTMSLLQSGSRSCSSDGHVQISTWLSCTPSVMKKPLQYRKTLDLWNLAAVGILQYGQTLRIREEGTHLAKNCMFRTMVGYQLGVS